MLHNRLKNWQFYAFLHVVQDDLSLRLSKESKGSSVFVYPNPTEGLFFVGDVRLNGLFELTVFDRWGKSVLYQTNCSSPSLVDISSFPNDIYYLHISTNNQLTTKRITKTIQKE